MIRTTLDKLGNRQNLREEEARDVMLSIMAGEWTAAQIAAFLMALKMKKETVDELSGLVIAMRQQAIKIAAPANAVDTCGTGGDGMHTFNISTAAAIVAAAAGVTVAKHGNRSVSSRCGSADVLEALGVTIDLGPQQAVDCLRQTGMTFLFAPTFHASMKHAAVPRREIGIRTAFNILGPMSNPAETKRQVIGCFNQETATKMVRVLQKLGSEHVLVVHSHDGLDEISLNAPTFVHELLHGEIREYQIQPEDMGLVTRPQDKVTGADAHTNAEIIRQVVHAESETACEVTALNAGAAIYVSGQAASLREGTTCAMACIRSGAAADKLEQWISFSQHHRN
jgi:anthranilate phosphoribosyltransferase